MKIRIIKKDRKNDVWYNNEDGNNFYDAVYVPEKMLYKITDVSLLEKYSKKYNNLFKALWVSKEYCEVIDDFYKSDLDKILGFE